MRPTRGVYIFLAMVALALCGIALWLRPLAPRTFDSAEWIANDRGYVRYAMSADLVARIVAEHWTEANVAKATGGRDGRSIGVGMRHAFDGTYYIRIEYDDGGKAVRATLIPS